MVALAKLQEGVEHEWTLLGDALDLVVGQIRGVWRCDGCGTLRVSLPSKMQVVATTDECSGSIDMLRAAPPALTSTRLN